MGWGLFWVRVRGGDDEREREGSCGRAPRLRPRRWRQPSPPIAFPHPFRPRPAPFDDEFGSSAQGRQPRRRPAGPRRRGGRRRLAPRAQGRRDGRCWRNWPASLHAHEGESSDKLALLCIWRREGDLRAIRGGMPAAFAARPVTARLALTRGFCGIEVAENESYELFSTVTIPWIRRKSSRFPLLP